MTAACVLQVQYQRTNKMCEKAKRHDIIFYNYWISSSALRFSLLKYLLWETCYNYPLTNTRSDRFASCENIISQSHASSHPSPLFLPFYIIQLLKSLRLDLKREAWRYPFQDEPLRIGPYREYTLGSWLILFPHSKPIWLHDRRSNNIHSIKTYFASSVNAIRPEAIAVAADVASKISIHPDFWSAVICGIGQISSLLPE